MTRRYIFYPLERRGVVLGLRAGQLATLAGSLLAAVTIGRIVGGRGGTVVTVLLLSAGAALAVWSKDGRALVEWAPIAAGWLSRGAGRAARDVTPLAGRPNVCTPVVRRHSLAPPGIRVIETIEGMGVVCDQRHSTCAGVIPVQGRPFSLLDPTAQEQGLEAWRTVLGALARPGTPVRRLQWVLRSQPVSADCAPTSDLVDTDEWSRDARASYRELTATAPPAQSHRVWLVVSVGGRPGRSSFEVLGREMRLLNGQLRAADLAPGGPLEPDDLAALIGPRPLATEDRWECWHADEDWHATYWISEWPRVEVASDFLSPILLSPTRRTVSVIMSPVPAERAVREARSARTADLADSEIRSRAGFLSSARRDQESAGALQREHELVEGHNEYRFSGYVTVSAANRSELAAACAEAEHSAQAAHLELRRLFGRQAEAFTWTQPLGRGLAGR